MTDPADRADKMTAAYLRAAMSRRAVEGPVATGWCLHCGAVLEQEPLPPLDGGVEREYIPRRWCDADCRDDWEREPR